MNLPERAIEKFEPPRVPKTAAVLMVIITVCLATLAVFANLQRLRHGDVESVVIRPAASPTPKAQQH